jgi:SAM-dependent MidA family methyltransferase
MVVGSAHTRVLVRDWGRADVGSTNAFEAVKRKATAGKMRTSIFVVQHDALCALN